MSESSRSVKFETMINNRYRWSLTVFLLSVWILPLCGRAELVFAPSWRAPTYVEVRGEVLLWLDSHDLNPATVRQLSEIWPEAPLPNSTPGQRMQWVVESFALIDPRARQLIDLCNLAESDPTPPDTHWLDDLNLPAIGRSNLRLYFARWLAQQSYYDEVLAILEGITPEQVADPAAFFFCQMVAYHQLVRPEESRMALTRLMEQENSLPDRYLQLAQLLQRDLATLENESLEHIARRMNDVRRRLQLGRAGDQVQMVEQGVLQSLDKLIKKIESQQQAAAAAASSGGSSQSGKPMEDSRPAGLKAPGRVTPRDIGHQSGWGELPDKERQQALQQVGREFPAYYREVIKQYFQELASEGEQQP
jgi:hypothetical protein